jgi:SAM-dependent methyltransferase
MTAELRGLSVVERIMPALRAGTVVADRAFDTVYPWEVRRHSSRHWTPVGVAVRAARFLARSPAARVLDVGAGPGKFCIVAAAVSGARVRGIERRAHLVDAARDAAHVLSVDIDVVHGELDDVDGASFDAFYLFNPFAENLERGHFAIDDSVETNPARFNRDVTTCERMFAEARMGTRVATFCGFGGVMPERWQCVSGGPLSLWEKR